MTKKIFSPSFSGRGGRGQDGHLQYLQRTKMQKES